MKEIFKAKVNNIMVPFKTDSQYLEGEQAIYLRSFDMHDNVLWDNIERTRREMEFERYNRGLLGSGYTLLISNDEGTLNEFYTGLEVLPCVASGTNKFDSNLGDSIYFQTNGINDETKLHIPTHLLKKVEEEDALDVIVGLFERRENVQEGVINPLEKRQKLIARQKVDSGYSMK